MSKVIVITGASEGIGAALAHHLGEEGHAVVLAARREAALKEVAAGMKGPVLTVVADVTRRSDVENVLARAVEAFGHVDVWVNNVGRGIARNVLDLTDEDVDEMVTINVKSALYGMQTSVRHFKERGEGHVVNVSSFLGRIPVASVRSMYSACKSALNSRTTNLRMDLRVSHPRIAVSLVMPGVVTTHFAKSALGVAPGAAHPAAAAAAGGRTRLPPRARRRPRLLVRRRRARPRSPRRSRRSLRARAPSSSPTLCRCHSSGRTSRIRKAYARRLATWFPRRAPCKAAVTLVTSLLIHLFPRAPRAVSVRGSATEVQPCERFHRTWRSVRQA